MIPPMPIDPDMIASLFQTTIAAPPGMFAIEVVPARVAAEVRRAYAGGAAVARRGDVEQTAAFAFVHAARLDVEWLFAEHLGDGVAPRVAISIRAGGAEFAGDGSNWAQAAFAVSASTLQIENLDDPKATPALVRMLALDHAARRVPIATDPLDFRFGVDRDQMGVSELRATVVRMLARPPDPADVCIAVFGELPNLGFDEVARLGEEIARLEGKAR